MTGQLPAIAGDIATMMHHLSDRQKVIAANIANADTPGFKARELDRPVLPARKGADAMVAKPRVALSTAMQAMGAHTQDGTGSVVDHGIMETKPDGNTVTLEEQVMKMGSVQADFAALSRLYAKQMALMKMALGKGG